MVARIELSSGIRLEYVDRGPRGADPAVVLIHGWPDSWRSFEPVLDVLPDDVRAISVSLRGFGDSDAPGGDYGPSTLAGDVVKLLDRLAVSSPVVVGHSMGSMVAQHIALRRPVGGLVLIGGFSHLPDDAAGELWEVVSALDDPIDVDFVREFQASTLAAPVPARFFDQLVTESLKAPARVWREAFDGLRRSDLRGELARIEAPTLLVWGDHDALIPRSEQEHLLAALPAARLEVYAGAGHSPNWEQPERVAADIAAFTRRVRRAAA